ncbi:hypothetical protein [Patulibacter minatonensis]|uniref:hypothetical protein n=1 Tax=Patulibacter minatonensis TaxID=298163 RepID=UPI00047DD70F|nr:hypothetical protein [Patulibacter minatonensis]
MSAFAVVQRLRHVARTAAWRAETGILDIDSIALQVEVLLRQVKAAHRTDGALPLQDATAARRQITDAMVIVAGLLEWAENDAT